MSSSSYAGFKRNEGEPYGMFRHRFPGQGSSRVLERTPEHGMPVSNIFKHPKLQPSEVHNPNVCSRVFHKNLESDCADLRQQLSRQTANNLYKSNAGVKRPTVYSGGGDDGEPQFDLRQQLLHPYGMVRPREVEYSGDNDEDSLEFYPPRAKRRHTDHSYYPSADDEYRGVSNTYP